MRLPAELQDALLLEFHLCLQSMRRIAHMHDTAMVDVQLTYYDVVDGRRHLHQRSLGGIAFEVYKPGTKWLRSGDCMLKARMEEQNSLPCAR